MKDWLSLIAPLLAGGGSLLSFAMAFHSYRSRARLIDRARSKIPPAKGPIVEDELVDPGFDNDEKSDVKDRDDE